MSDLMERLSLRPNVFGTVTEFLMEYGFVKVDFAGDRMKILDGPSPRQTAEILRTFSTGRIGASRIVVDRASPL
jgi:hypothetical protein